MNRSPEPHSPLPNRRRKLLRATFSAPVVLTLYSGGASAAASSTACLANATSASVPPPSTSTDNYCRVALHWDATSKCYWVSGKELGTNVVTGTSLPQSTQWMQFDSKNDKLVTTVCTSNQPKGCPNTPPKKYAALCFDKQGKVCGVSQGGSNGGVALTQSCMLSITV